MVGGVRQEGLKDGGAVLGGLEGGGARKEGI